MILLKVDLAFTFTVHGPRMCTSTEEFFSSMCTQVGDKTVSNEEKNPAIVVLLILVDEANMMKKRRIEMSLGNLSLSSSIFQTHTVKKYSLSGGKFVGTFVRMVFEEVLFITMEKS